MSLYRIFFKLKGPTSYAPDKVASYTERAGSTIVKAKSKEEARKKLKNTDEFKKIFKTVKDLDEPGIKPRLTGTKIEDASTKPKFKYKDPPELSREAKQFLEMERKNPNKDMFKNYSKGGRLNDGTTFIKSLYKDKL